ASTADADERVACGGDHVVGAAHDDSCVERHLRLFVAANEDRILPERDTRGDYCVAPMLAVPKPKVAVEPNTISVAAPTPVDHVIDEAPHLIGLHPALVGREVAQH